ncbi:MAG: 30S ribosome-binding factor RbfA [Chloroflexi bacterium]|nr:30S ribosome-binding factor RbfA [Chloroflexota bacterium]
MTRRTERINDLLREEIAELVRREVKDPRMGGLVSILEVQVSPDLRNAKVYVSVLGSDEEKASTLVALAAAAHFIQRQLGKRLTIRRTPELSFLADETIEEGTRIMSLLDEALGNDGFGRRDRKDAFIGREGDIEILSDGGEDVP